MSLKDRFKKKASDELGLELLAELVMGEVFCNEKKALSLISRGADVNINSGKGTFTPLHWAAKNGSLTCVKALIEKGAKLDAISLGRTPLDMAQISNHAAVAALLEKELLAIEAAKAEEIKKAEENRRIAEEDRKRAEEERKKRFLRETDHNLGLPEDTPAPQRIRIKPKRLQSP